MGTRNPFWPILLSGCLITAPLSLDGCKNAKPVRAQASQTQQTQQAPTTTYATPTADELYQLVAPIALFPDNLVAQVLAGSTYPDQIEAAHTWLQQNSSLAGDKLTQAVDQQPWDASVKGLTQFADVLNQMATNLSWTSALGDAYFNIPQNVMNAVQVMRQRAQGAGNLKTTQQQKVTVENQAPATPAPTDSSQPIIVQAPPQTIIIQPAQPQVVYVPTYNPTLVYGAPVAVYPGYSTAALVATSAISFGVGMAIGAAISGGWGWNSWGCGWRNSTVIYNRNVYVSRSNTFVNRNNYYGRNVNNVNVNNVNRTNINRNSVNNNYRANNFNNTARNNNVTTPNFNQKYNQPQFNNNRGNPAQSNGQQFKGANPSGFNQQNRATSNQNQSRPNNLSQPQRENARGYGQQPDRGTSRGAFSSYGQGGNTMANGARGQQSLQGNRTAPSRQSRATGVGRR